LTQVLGKERQPGSRLAFFVAAPFSAAEASILSSEITFGRDEWQYSCFL
jgi:hypothetical protein